MALEEDDEKGRPVDPVSLNITACPTIGDIVVKVKRGWIELYRFVIQLHQSMESFVAFDMLSPNHSQPNDETTNIIVLLIDIMKQ